MNTLTVAEESLNDYFISLRDNVVHSAVTRQV